MRLQRLLGILATLLRQRRVRAQDLADKFEVSIRTIHRDLETLEQAGVPLVTYPGVNGGIEIIDTYKLDKNVFLNEDFTTLLCALKSISPAVDTAAINRTLAKLEALIPDNQAEHLALSGNKLYIDLKPWSIHPDFGNLFHTVKTALDQNRLLHFTYTAREDTPQPRTVEPHQLLLKEEIWYLRAYCLERGDFRTFRLQRMEHAQLTDEYFVPRPFPAEPNDFKSWIHPGMITVEILAPASKRHELLEHCRPEYITNLDNDMIHLRLPFVDSEYGYGTLVMMGPECRVISPPAVIAGLKKHLTKMLQNYSDETDL